jgi:hypothetical protein
VRQVIGEEDEQRQAEEHQRDGHRHREPRELVAAHTAGDAHGEQAAGAVGERADQHAQHDLVRPVAQEVAQQPGRELRGRQLQRHDGEAEHDGDDRDHGPTDPAQQRPRVVRGALEGQR